MGRIQLLLSALLLGVLLTTCAPAAVPTRAPQASTPAAAPAPVPAAGVPIAPARPLAWQEEWERTVDLAKKEGRVLLYTSMSGEQRQALPGAFRTKYGIPVESVTLDTSRLAPKLAIERRAGIYSGDIMIGSTTPYKNFPQGTLDSLEPLLILPELTEPELIKKTWLIGELYWGDKARTTLMPLIRASRMIGINTNLVKPGEITAYRDLLDPKWKGEMSLNDPQVAGMGEVWFAVVLELGDVDVNYMRELGTKQELFITRDRRLQPDGLAKGKHAIAIAMQDAAELEFVRAGAPIKRINPGSAVVSGGGGSGIALLNRAPHPNAVKLFVNWLLSQEGQTVHSLALERQSQRVDVPTTHLDPSDVLSPGFKGFRTDTEEFAIKRAKYYGPLSKEVWEPFTK